MTGVQYLDHQGARLAYRHTPGAGPLIVFLPGYMSDMTGSKAEALADWAAATGRALLRLDYSGCGASAGDFLAGSIGRWVADARAVIDHVAPAGRVLLVGSSMGGWVALHLGLGLGGRLAGLVGIAAAPDFTEWGLAITAADRTALATQGWFTRSSDYDPQGYRYSAALIADAPAQLLLGGPIAITAPVRLLHGQRDDLSGFSIGIALGRLPNLAQPTGGISQCFVFQATNQLGLRLIGAKTRQLLKLAPFLGDELVDLLLLLRRLRLTPSELGATPLHFLFAALERLACTIELRLSLERPLLLAFNLNPTLPHVLLMRLAKLEHFLLARNDRAPSKRLRLTLRLIQHAHCAFLGDDERPLLLGGLHLTPRLSSDHVRDDSRDKPKGAN